MNGIVYFLPIITTLVALAFGASVFGRYRQRGGRHLLWWAIGLVTYAVGAGTEAATTLFGWSEPVFRTWYITGALLGGAPLAQGTVYLLLRPQTADRFTIALVTVILVGSVLVVLSPIDYTLVESFRPSGRVLVWRWVRLVSPFVNLYALFFLVGGAVLSAVRYARKGENRARVAGNVLIACGAILPGIGGTATRFGVTEALYVTELLGLALINLGYRTICAAGDSSRPRSRSQGFTLIGEARQ
jgi:hypothetical protein